jgi:ADP-ribose pyrophosphatase YjhB (NUDIX family)
MENLHSFNVILLGIIYDPKTKKILLSRRENDPYLKDLSWCFPGGRAIKGEDIDKTLKNTVKTKTGLEVKNLGTVFSRSYPGKEEFLQIFFLCEVFKGKEKAGDKIVELKWVSPEEVEGHFSSPFNTRLKEYILSLK